MVIPASALYVSVQEGCSSFYYLSDVCTTLQEAETRAVEDTASDLALAARHPWHRPRPFKAQDLSSAIQEIAGRARDRAVLEHEYPEY